MVQGGPLMCESTLTDSKGARVKEVWESSGDVGG